MQGALWSGVLSDPRPQDPPSLLPAARLGAPAAFGEQLEGCPPLLEAQEPVRPVPPSFFLPRDQQSCGWAPIPSPGARRGGAGGRAKRPCCGPLSSRAVIGSHPRPPFLTCPAGECPRAQGREVGGEEGGPLQSRSEESPVPAASSWVQLDPGPAPRPGSRASCSPSRTQGGRYCPVASLASGRAPPPEPQRC